MDNFIEEQKQCIKEMIKDRDLFVDSINWIAQSSKYKYSYNFTWCGLPIIQFPQDIVAMQELIWHYQPDLIIETGVARGGSIVFYASLLNLLGGKREVVGIDIEIRSNNKKAISASPFSDRIRLIEGSSTDNDTVDMVMSLADGFNKPLVILDSMHTHEHVLTELTLYSPLIKPGGYIVVFDTIIEDLPTNYFPNRPWKPGNSPKTAIDAFLTDHKEFRRDPDFDEKLLISVMRGGILIRKQ